MRIKVLYCLQKYAWSCTIVKLINRRVPVQAIAPISTVKMSSVSCPLMTLMFACIELCH
jgi:hypothetical protein